MAIVAAAVVHSIAAVPANTPLGQQRSVVLEKVGFRMLMLFV